MGCGNSKSSNENLDNLGRAGITPKDGHSHQVHLPSVSNIDATGTTPTATTPDERHLDLPVDKSNPAEHSTSSMVTQAPSVAASADAPSTRSSDGSEEEQPGASPPTPSQPHAQPELRGEVPSQSFSSRPHGEYTPNHSYQMTPTPEPQIQALQQPGNGHFKPPISRQQSHSKSITSTEHSVGIVRRQDSRQRAITDSVPQGGYIPELSRPSSKSDVTPKPSGRFGTLAAAQPISVARAEHASNEKQQEMMRRAQGSYTPTDPRQQNAQVHNPAGFPQNQSLFADPRNPRPSISRSHTAPNVQRFDPSYALDDEYKNGYSEREDSRTASPNRVTARGQINARNPRAVAAKRASKQWNAGIPPPPMSMPPPGPAQSLPMTPVTHHQQQQQHLRKSRENASPYPGTGSRTPQGMQSALPATQSWGFAADHTAPSQGMGRAQTARQTPVMYGAPAHPSPLTSPVPQYGAAQYGAPNEMPRSGTYHAGGNPQPRQMRGTTSYDIPPQQQHAGTPGPPQSAPPTHHSSQSGRKKRKKKKRLGDRGQISEKAFYEKYWIESGVLGEGSFARVRRITRKTDQAPFALKLIKKRGMTEDDLTALEKEIAILQKLNHPNVVQITDYCDTSKRIYMVVEFCEGGDVFSRIIAQSKFSESDASHVIRSVTQGLEHCHANGIVHRDLKPDNLMYLTSEPTSPIKIIDFGLAGDLQDGPLKTPCGTAHYVAPEVLEGTRYGTEADMWSLGVILYMLLCGFPPFFDQTGNHHRLYKIIKRGEYSFPTPYWDDVSADAKDLITNLLIKNPRERLNAQQALRHPWLGGGTVSDRDFSKQYLTQMTHFNSSRHFTERRLGTEDVAPMQSISLFSPEWSMQQHQEQGHQMQH